MRRFGCLCYPTTPKIHKTKSELRATSHLFVEYPFDTKQYKVLNLSSKRIHISGDVIFYETIFLFSLFFDVPKPSIPNLNPNFVFDPAAPMFVSLSPSHPQSTMTMMPPPLQTMCKAILGMPPIYLQNQYQTYNHMLHYLLINILLHLPHLLGNPPKLTKHQLALMTICVPQIHTALTFPACFIFTLSSY